MEPFDCPLCGEPGIIIERNAYASTLKVFGPGCYNEDCLLYAGNHVNFFTREQALAAWNRRPGSPTALTITRETVINDDGTCSRKCGYSLYLEHHSTGGRIVCFLGLANVREFVCLIPGPGCPRYKEER